MSHYQLALDKDGNSVFQPGDNHRKVYVTASSNGLSVAEIAAREKIAVSKITGEWLEANPEYGGTSGMALDQEAGMRVWNWIAGRESGPSSHWLLIERGHTYDKLGNVLARGSIGEDPQHPIVVTTWGSGNDPVVNSQIKGFQNPFENVAIVDLDLRKGMLLLNGENVLLEDLDFTGTGLNVQYVDGVTLRRSTVTEVHYDKPQNGATEWNSASKIQGVFIKSSDGVLIEDVLIDQTGWETGYDYNLSASKPQAPSKFSHNFYIQKDVTDLIFRDNVSMRGAEAGAQIRSGGVIEGNVFIANDAAFNVGIGNGVKSMVRDNLVTLAGYHDVRDYGGALAWGIDGQGKDTSFIGNIVAHHTDPTDSAARATRVDAGKPFQNKLAAVTNDTIVYNWETATKQRPDINMPDVSRTKLDDTTIKSFVEDVLGRNGGTDGVEALATWLKQNWHSSRSEADLILDYFQSAFRSGSGPGPKPEPSPGPAPKPEPNPGPEPGPDPAGDYNLLSGTQGNDKLAGKKGVDNLFQGSGGDDLMTGRNGNDVFVFGDATKNGEAENDRLRNFDPDHDVVGLEAGAAVEWVRQFGSDTRIRLEGGDIIRIADVDASDVVIEADWMA